MITLEQAKQIVKKELPKADAYYDYPDVFWFRISKPVGDEIWDNALIIKKKDGKIVSMFDYVFTDNYMNLKPSLKKL